MTSTVILLVNSGNWRVPSDYGTPSTVDCFGCGSSGQPGSTFPDATGGLAGGGAAWARKNNLALTTGALIPIQIGGQNVSNSLDTWFQSAAVVLAKGGNGTDPGLAANCVGDAAHSGGNSGGVNGGGGGGAGPLGAGVNATSGQGGTGGGGFGGAGGTMPGANGFPGAEYTLTGGGTAGSGGGGAGSTGPNTGNAGLYGAAGGGAAPGDLSNYGSGGQGCIIITYTPTTSGGGRRRIGVSVSG